MSRLSDAQEFKEANERMIYKIAQLDNSDLFLSSECAIIADTALKCLLLLAEIADMMEDAR